jgi:hypothetical protein
MICALACSASAGGTAETAASLAERDTVKVYSVNRKVADFPDKEDMSTPEAAYATLNRLCATGAAEPWGQLTVPWRRNRLPTERREISTPKAAEFLSAEIVEVHLWEQTNAVAIAQMLNDFDLRWLCCMNGRWLNVGNERVVALEKARTLALGDRAWEIARRLRGSRLSVTDPEKHLGPFVEFLKAEAADPQEFLLKALTQHQVVILGEHHHLQRYWSFNTSLVRSAGFAKRVGVVYLELPMNDQPLVDQFLRAPQYDAAPVLDTLRDMLDFGWPDGGMLEFCQAVWEVNQTQPKEQRVRIVLVDMARPWKQIRRREDWEKYDVDRNEFMANQIVRDQREHAADARHALFIVGYTHAPKNLTFPDGNPFKSAGWHLCQALGQKNVFSVFPHAPVMSNSGSVDGRLALGLFDTAFGALSNRPMAFPLDHGPFGELLFDASLDVLTADPYRAGFDAFLFLGPLENEVGSPLIPGFYTDEFAREMDRRSRLMHGHGLEDVTQVSGEAVRREAERWWGQPLSWQLGPLDAWHYGSAWREQLRSAKYREALKDPALVRQQAEKLFTFLRQAEYRQDPETLYCVQTDRPGWLRWMGQHFGTNPIVHVEFGEVRRQASGRPAVPYKLDLKDGTKLEGVLPFEWDPNDGKWQGVGGLDWHLQK